jgi:hypothetical protein
MKKSALVLRLLITTMLLFPAIEAISEDVQVRIEHYTEGEGRPTVKHAPVICFADKETGYVGLIFSRNFGGVSI